MSEWDWRWQWDRVLTDSVHRALSELESLIADFRPVEGAPDRWFWVPNPGEGFMVRSRYGTLIEFYGTLIEIGEDSETTLELRKAIKRIWVCGVSSKVSDTRMEIDSKTTGHKG